jgi:glutamate-1-semialdehyde 2,1-aminomutase
MLVVAVVQARCGSTRFPEKVLTHVGKKPMISVLIDRLSHAKKIDKIILATTDNVVDKKLANIAGHLGVQCHRGSELDVLSRYAGAAESASADVVVRITGDCPLVDPDIVDQTIELYLNGGVDYCSNSWPPTYPDGLDVEVFSRKALLVANTEAKDNAHREHVTPFFRESGLFACATLKNGKDLSHMRWTVDEPEDLEVIQNIFDNFPEGYLFGWQEVLWLSETKPELFNANKHLSRNEGSKMSESQKLWRRAKKIIPGGNMLLSKRPEMFLPEIWPSYYSKTCGAKVWDLDGNEYIDMSLMGVGTNSLGYSHPEIDDAVRTVIQHGNLSTLNCPEEVYLAERLIDLHPWAEMVKFARTGGEANSIAVRIGRAASGRDGVAMCGYHGWHDWYLAANLKDANGLVGHLLPGLVPNGVPKNLYGSTHTFKYNDYAKLVSLVGSGEIGVIIMEVMRNEEPEKDFLENVRKLATDHGIVLIFDECTSGFRQTFGGIHKHYGVDPDIAVFGKALGNGYSITSVIGRRNVMEAAQETFVSSTFWTERIGPAAALTALKVMEREKSWEKITKIGNHMKDSWQMLADFHGLKISHQGLPAIANISFDSEMNLPYKTLISQEMLKHGYLASNAFYASTSHTEEMIDAFSEKLSSAFAMISQCENGVPLDLFLKSDVCYNGFTRLN